MYSLDAQGHSLGLDPLPVLTLRLRLPTKTLGVYGLAFSCFMATLAF